MLLATRRPKNNLVRTVLASTVLISSLAYLEIAHAAFSVITGGAKDNTTTVPALASGGNAIDFQSDDILTILDTFGAPGTVPADATVSIKNTSGGANAGTLLTQGSVDFGGTIGIGSNGAIKLITTTGVAKNLTFTGAVASQNIELKDTTSSTFSAAVTTTQDVKLTESANARFAADLSARDLNIQGVDHTVTVDGDLVLTRELLGKGTGTSTLLVRGTSTITAGTGILSADEKFQGTFTGNVSAKEIKAISDGAILTFNGQGNSTATVVTASGKGVINFNGGGTAANGVTLADDDSRVNFNASYAINLGDLDRNDKSIIGIKTGATVTVAIDMTNANAGSQLIFDLGNTITPGTFAIGGTATIADDQFVTIENYNLGLLGVGATVTKNLVTDAGGGVATKPTLIAPNNVFINFTLDIPNANTLNLVMTRQVPAGLEGNSNSLAQILAQMDQTNVDGALEGLLDGVGDIAKTLDDLNEELAEIAPQGINGGISNSVMNMTNETFDLFSQRIGELRAGLDSYHTGYAAGHMDEKGHGTWVKIFGNHADQSKRGNIAGYTGETWGIAGGADLMLTERHLVGVSASWGSTNVNFDSQRGGTDINSYQGAFYGSWNIKTPLFFNWMASGAYNKYKETQIVSTGGFNQTSLGDFKGWNYGARGELGYVFGEESFHITPTLGLTYSHVSFDSFRQRGVSTANQIIDYGSVSALLAGAGVKFSYDCEMEKALLQPEVHTNVSYDILGEEMDANSRFVGFATGYNVQGASVKRTDYNVGASLTTWGDSGLGLSISYDYDWKSTYHAHSGFVRVRYEW